MLENFIYAKQKSLFEEKLNNGEVLDEAIVFIEDTKEIWNHGTYFDGSTFDFTDIEASIQNILDTKQDNISDLETIRSGAALGATAVQPAAITDMETKTNAAATYQPIGDYATKAELPTKVSELENDVPYVVDAKSLPENGLYIYDTDGNFTSPDNWDTANNDKAVGVAILTDDCRFVVAKEDISTNTIRWGGYGTDISTLTNYTDATSAATDFDGVGNTSKIIKAIGDTNDGYRDGTAAGDCAAYTFPNGKTGYLGAAGEWQVARQNKEDLNSALTLIGGTTMTEGGYWTSTEYSSTYAWYQWFDSGSYLNDGNKAIDTYYVRAFLAIEETKSIKERISSLENKITNLDNTLVVFNEDINYAVSKSEQAEVNSKDAVTTANTARDAIAALEGLANANEAQQTLSGLVVQIEQNKNDIIAIKNNTVYLTQDEYDALLTNGEVSSNVEYNIYEE